MGIYCDFISKVTNYTVTFLFNGSDLCTSSSSVRVWKLDKGLSCKGKKLIIPLAHINNSGLYQCIVSDNIGESIVVKFVVTPKPTNGMLNSQFYSNKNSSLLIKSKLVMFHIQRLLLLLPHQLLQATEVHQALHPCLLLRRLLPLSTLQQVLPFSLHFGVICVDTTL